MFFAIYPSGYLMGKDSHTPLMKRACSSVDTVARQVITTSLLATGAPGSVNYLLEREREREREIVMLLELLRLLVKSAR